MKARGILILLLGGFLLLDVLLLGGYWLLSRRATVPAPSSALPAPKQDSVARALVTEGFDFKRQGKFAEAAASFEAAIRAEPGYSDSYHGLAQTQREMGHPAEALANHDRAIELDPKRHSLYWERGVTHQRLRDYDAAIQDFEACLERNPQFANAHLGLGECYRAKSDLQKSLRELDQAIALKPDSDWFYRERGNTYQKMGEQDRAAADFAKMRELQQNKQ